jgi:hypothetical protein
MTAFIITTINGATASLTLPDDRIAATLGTWQLSFDQGVGKHERRWEASAAVQESSPARLASGGPFALVAHAGRRTWCWRNVEVVNHEGGRMLLRGKGFPEETYD